ncbi:MAG: TGS domain-containing protein [Candidatus Gracilibacteria bacterium]
MEADSGPSSVTALVVVPTPTLDLTGGGEAIRNNEHVLEDLAPEMSLIDPTHDIPLEYVVYDGRTEDIQERLEDLADMRFVDEVFDSLRQSGVDTPGFIDEELRTWGKQMVLLIQRRHRQFHFSLYSHRDIRILVTEMFHVDLLHRLHRNKPLRDDGTLYSREHLFKSTRNAIVYEGITDLYYLVALLHHDDGEDLSEIHGVGKINPELLLMAEHYELEPEEADSIQVLRRGVEMIVRTLTKDQIVHKSDLSTEEDNFRLLLERLEKEVLVVLARLADRLHNLMTLEGKAKRKPERAREIALTSLKVHARLAGVFAEILHDAMVEACTAHLNPNLLERFTTQRAERIQERVLLPCFRGCLDDVLKIAGEKELSLKFIGYRPKSLGASVDASRVHEPDYDPFAVDAEDDGIDPWDPMFETLILIKDPRDTDAVINAVTSAFRRPSERGAVTIEVHQEASMDASQREGTLIRIFDHKLGGRCFVRVITEEAEAKRVRGVFANEEQGEKLCIPPHYRQAVQRILDQTHRDATGIFELAGVEFLNAAIFVLTPWGERVTLPAGALALDFPAAIHEDVLDGCTDIVVRKGLWARPVKASPFSVLKNGDVVEVKTGGGASSIVDPSWSVLGNSHTRGALREVVHRKGREFQGQSGAQYLARLERLFNFDSKRLLGETRRVPIDVGALYLDPLEKLAQRHPEFATSPIEISVEVLDQPDMLAKLSHEFGRHGLSIVGNWLRFGRAFQKGGTGPSFKRVRGHVQSLDLERVPPYDVLRCLLEIDATYPLRVIPKLFED